MTIHVNAFLRGGLGNMMFQIAAAHGYLLNCEKGWNCFFSEKDHYLPMQGEKVKKYKNNIFSNINILDKKLIRNPKTTVIYKEPSFTYSEIPKFNKEYVILGGYFQSEKYFENCKDLVFKNFGYHQKLRDHLKQYNSIALHIRRGDYLYNESVHPVLGLEYYKEALTKLDLNNYDGLIVFSDDLQWCKENVTRDSLDVELPVVFSDDLLSKKNQKDHIELHCMACADAVITANSSFSWWAAWLAEYGHDATVIAPKKWFGPKGPSDKDLVPDRWERV